jgi:hypothetical protein
MESIERVPLPARAEHIFVIRVWYEAGVADPDAWRGSVEHAGSGARRYFSDYATLTGFIAAQARPAQARKEPDGKNSP